MQNKMDINRPKPFNPNKNQVAKDWQVWKKEFLTYLKLSDGCQTLSEETRSLLLQNLMGTKAVEAMENMDFDNPQDKDNMNILLAKFDEIFDPPSNEVEGRYKFFSRMKGKNESIEKYVMDLKEKAKKCNFGDQTEKFIIDMIIRNMDSYLRQMTFKDKEIYLESIIENYKQYIIQTEKIKELSETMAKDFNSEKKNDTSNSNNSPRRSKEKPQSCWKCNTSHQPQMCPAYGKVCHVCNERNHLNGLCRKKLTGNNDEQVKRICSKCGKNHSYKECPAFYNICQQCNQKGHYRAQCAKLKAMNSTKIAANKQNNECSSSDLLEVPPPSYIQATTSVINNAQLISNLEDCLWCGSRHLPGRCAHNSNCSYCTQFPHKICFNCKHNPHLDNCYYKVPIPKTKVNPNTTSYCHSCNDNPYVYCWECKHKTFNSECSKGMKENFDKVEYSNVSNSDQAQFQSRRPEQKKGPPPRFNTKKKDDPCCIS